MLTFLIQACVVLMLPLLLWSPLRRFVPLVLMQILSGIALASVIGVAFPEGLVWLFPPESISALGGLSSLALVCVSAAAGMHLNLRELSSLRRRLAAISVSAFVGPALAGALLSLLAAWVEPTLIGPNGSVFTFALGGALCFGVTALPVLVSILRELRMLDTPLGRAAIAIAASNDLVLWLLMSFLLGTLALPAQQLEVGWQLLGLLGFALVLGLLRRLLRQFGLPTASQGPLSTVQISFLLLCVLVCALMAEALHLHAAIGAFAAGALIPGRVAKQVTLLLEPMTHALLLPFFFVMAGFRVSLEDPLWWFIAASIVVGSASKIVCTAVTAHTVGWAWRDALQLGALMQCRGLMEILVLSVLFDAGLISRSCFSSLVVMAVATTALALPLVRLLERRSDLDGPIKGASGNLNGD